MRVSIRVGVIAGTLLLAAGLSSVAVLAADPEPLLKPVTPRSTAARIRVATLEEDPVFYHLAARAPKAKAAKGEMMDVTVAFDNRSGKSYVTAKKWRSWGYEVPANKSTVLSELVIPGTQIAPKPKSGRDANIRLRNVKLEIIEPPGGVDTVLQSDLLLSLHEITRGAERTFEPRFYFADKFLELTVPTTAIIRPESDGMDDPPEPTVATDEKLVTAACPTVIRKEPVLGFASIDGKVRYQLADGSYENVNVVVSSAMTGDNPMISIGTARGCGITIEDGKDVNGLSVGNDLDLGVGKLKEFRLGMMTGPGLKTAQDLVLKDVKVFIDKHDSGHIVYIGPRFIRTHFTDPVYALGTDGVWRLHGRIKPELLQSIKTRTPEKKP